MFGGGFGTSGFGQQTPQQSKSNFGGFGTPAASAPTGFATAAPSTTPFSFTSQQNAPQTGFGFGATPAATPNKPTGFGFGGNTTSSTSTPGFSLGGATITTMTGTPGSGLFGAPATTSATSTPGTGLFAATAAPTGGGLFGTAATPGTGFGLLGKTATTTTSGGAGGLFKTAASNTLGGGPSFGQGTQQTSHSTFGQPGGSIIGLPPSQQLGTSTTQVPHMQFGARQALSLQDQLVLIKNSWDPLSPSCVFKHYFYNMVHPSEVQYYARPAPQDEALWQQAQRDNPDPTWYGPEDVHQHEIMIPALAIGFGDLRKRKDEQEKFAQAHTAKLDEIDQRINTLQQTHYLETTVKLEEFKRRHMELAHRVLSLIKKVQIIRNKGYSIRPEEEDLRVRLEDIQMQLKKPSQFRGRLSELSSQLQNLKESQRPAIAGIEYEVVNEEMLDVIRQALSEVQTGLSHLTETLKEDAVEVENMEKGYAESAPILR